MLVMLMGPWESTGELLVTQESLATAHQILCLRIYFPEGVSTAFTRQEVHLPMSFCRGLENVSLAERSKSRCKEGQWGLDACSADTKQSNQGHVLFEATTSEAHVFTGKTPLL